MRTGKLITIIVAGAAAICLLVFGTISIIHGLSPNNQLPNRNYSYGPGMMGGYGNGPGGMMGGYGYNPNNTDTKTESEIQAVSDSAMQNTVVDEQANTITYSGSDITIVILGGPEQADEKFVIGGLVNPTLYVPKDANVTIEFANADEGMPHAFEITNAEPPYNYMSMMDSGWIYPGSFISTLPEASNGNYPVAETAFQASEAGTFYYICQYPGHAAEGMYGSIIVE